MYAHLCFMKVKPTTENTPDAYLFIVSLLGTSKIYEKHNYLHLSRRRRITLNINAFSFQH